jgi:hypothetical protein
VFESCFGERVYAGGEGVEDILFKREGQAGKVSWPRPCFSYIYISEIEQGYRIAYKKYIYFSKNLIKSGFLIIGGYKGT